MVKCPFCRKEINELRYFTTIVKEYSVTIENGELHFEPVDTHEDVFGSENYCCPECGETITIFREEAKRFLEGEKIEPTYI